MTTVGLVGCGNIGSQLAQEIQKRLRGTARLIGLYDKDLSAARRLIHRLHPPVPLLSLNQLVRRSQLLIEAASPEAVTQLLPQVIKRRRSLLILSSGGLLQRPRLRERAMARKIPIYLPSGALGAIDAIKAAAQAGALRSVVLTTRKPPRAFQGAPEVIRKGIRLSTLRKPRLLFQGTAEKAVKAFPQNINVAATLALAGLGPTRTKVRVVADPTVKENVHEVEAIGSFGRIYFKAENRPLRRNPKTSRLAMHSAVATLRQIFQSLKVGT